jgi:hypothetical protein
LKRFSLCAHPPILGVLLNAHKIGSIKRA